MDFIIFPFLSEQETRLPFQVAGIGCAYEQEPVIRPNGYPRYQWIQTRSGKGELVTEGERHQVGPGQGMLLFPHRPHEYRALSEHWEVDWVLFDGLQASVFLNQLLGLTGSAVLHVSDGDALSEKMRNLYDTAVSDDPLKGLENSVLLYGLLMALARQASIGFDTSMNRRFNRFQPLFDHIEANSSQPLTLGGLSLVAGMSPQYLCTAFKKAMGMRLFEYINRVRIQKSKTLLLDSGIRVSDVARRSGFEDPSYYCAIFRKLENVSPGEFRQMHTKGG